MNPIDCYETGAARRIYSIPVRSFPNLITNVFVISDGERRALIDCGSGIHHANDDLVDGLAAIGEQYNETISLASLDTIFITHGHIDHFGGLPFVRQHNATAPIGVHVLDRSVVDNNAERVTVTTGRLRTFLTQTGLPAKHRQQLMQVYLFGKSFYQSTPVQFLLKEGRPMPHDLIVHHVPGHCPGLVCLQIDDILLTADHILSRTTPHQAPEWIVPNMGLTHYFESLDKIARLQNIRLGLGSHEQPINDLAARVAAIKQMHEGRLQKIVEICREPHSIHEISLALFGKVKRYHILLALEEAGAHVEYLHQRGELLAANVDEIEQDFKAVVRYVRR